MARPRRCRKICTEPAYDSFKPEGISVGEEITMTVDEYEVIRLVDLEKYTHEQCAERMGIGKGNADKAIEAYLKGNLDYNPEVHCTTHEHGHSCGEHHCGEEKHGCSGNGENQ